MTDPIDRLIEGMSLERKRAVRGIDPKNLVDPRIRDRDQVRMGWVNTRAERDLIDQAAAIRDISLNAFLRRAVLSFGYHVLGMDYYEQMKGESPVNQYDYIELQPGKYKRFKVEDSKDGRGAGPWRITGLD